jgi:hypothetical protein
MQPPPTINIVTPSNSPDKEKKLAEGEKARIRAACSLSAEEFQDKLPAFYTDWVRHGKTKEAVRTWLTHHLQSNGPVARLHPSTIYISDDMVNDVNALNFGRGGELTYLDCHRGLSPFMCPAVGAKKRKELDKMQERQTRATMITPEDVRLSETAHWSIRFVATTEPVLGSPRGPGWPGVPPQIGGGSDHRRSVRKWRPVRGALPAPNFLCHVGHTPGC